MSDKHTKDKKPCSEIYAPKALHVHDGRRSPSEPPKLVTKPLDITLNGKEPDGVACLAQNAINSVLQCTAPAESDAQLLQKPWPVCHLCKRRFTTSRGLASHLKAHNRPKKTKFDCDSCDCTFSFEGDYKRHIDKRAQGKIYQCVVCSQTFCTRRKMIEHNQLTSNDKDHLHLRSQFKARMNDENRLPLRTPFEAHITRPSVTKDEDHLKQPFKAHIKDLNDNDKDPLHLKQPFKAHIKDLNDNEKNPLRLKQPLKAHNKDLNGNDKDPLHLKQPFKAHIKDLNGNDKDPLHLRPSLKTRIKGPNGIMFWCDSCECELTLQESKHHSDKHAQGKMYPCVICAKTFGSPLEIHAHKQLHNNDIASLQCRMCGTSFANRQLLQQHLSAYLNPLACKNCGLVFYLASELDKHTEEHHLKCTACSGFFDGVEDLRHHFSAMHSELLIDKPWNACTLCEAVFEWPSALGLHCENHLCRTCAVCQLELSSAVALKKHMKMHLSEDAFHCHICKESFRRLKEACAHIRHAHAESSSLLINLCHCTSCKQVFGTAAALRKHTCRKVATSVSCTKCRKEFTKHSMLEEHMIVHKNPCGVCGATYAWHRQLRKHQYTSHGIVPYGCCKCTQRFVRRSQLWAHMRLMHDITNPCTTCDAILPSADALEAHRSYFHKTGYCRQCRKSVSNVKTHMLAHEKQKIYTASKEAQAGEQPQSEV